MSVYVFDNVVDVMNKFEEYKSETQSKWRKVETRGPLFLTPGPDTFETIQHLTLRGPHQNRCLTWAPLRTLNDHVPYVPIGRHVYGCFYGADPSRPRKLKTLEKEVEHMSEEEKKVFIEERRSSLGISVVQCTARVRLNYVVKFPTLKTHIHEKRRAMTHLFDEIMRTNPTELLIKHTYVLELPHDSSHSDHPLPDLSVSAHNKTGDRAMNDAVQCYMRGRNTVSQVIINTDENDDYSGEEKEEISPSMPSTVDELAQQVMNENMNAFSTPKSNSGGNKNHTLYNESVVGITQVSQIGNNKDRQVFNESIVGTGPAATHTSREEKMKEVKEIPEVISSSRHRSSNEHQLSKKVVNNSDDPDEFFLLSLLPQFKMLTPKKASEVRIEFLKVLHNAQFEGI